MRHGDPPRRPPYPYARHVYEHDKSDSSSKSIVLNYLTATSANPPLFQEIFFTQVAPLNELCPMALQPAISGMVWVCEGVGGGCRGV